MALIIMRSGRKHFVSAAKAVSLWQVYNREREGNEAEKQFCSNIRQIFLSRHTAPRTYLEKYPNRLREDREMPRLDMGQGIRTPFKD